MSTPDTAGIGDPYWYEWSVGLHYIVQMLEPETAILSVTLQEEKAKGLDDVVVRLSDRCVYVQVKHSRTDDSLTFGNLVEADDGKRSVLARMAEGWKKAVAGEQRPCEALLFTNRAGGTRPSTISRDKGPIERPALRAFLEALEDSLSRADILSEVEMPDSMRDAWEREWLPQLEILETDAQRLLFLRSFRVRDSAPDLATITSELDSNLQRLFGVPAETARSLRRQLDAALRTWSTSLGGEQRPITQEQAYQALELRSEAVVGSHDLAPPAPFFPSRMEVVRSVQSGILRSDGRITFLSAPPGSGKTAIISELNVGMERSLDLRYFAYRPITPENQVLPADSGETTKARSLWNDLLIQARRLAKRHGWLAALRVPVASQALSTDDLRAEVLRVANGIGQRRGRDCVIAIDGIDHAARAGEAIDSFLGSLVPPTAVPEHVRFLIAGQPAENYANYPSWLRIPTNGVMRIEIPPLSRDDTRAFLASRLPQVSEAARESLAAEVHQHCEGNTLSTVFAAEEAALLGGDPVALAGVLTQRGLSGGVDAYYQSIWSSLASQSRLGTTAYLRLAACLSLAPTRCSIQLLLAVVPDPSGSADLWRDALRHLRPLLVEEESGYRVFHNDVRVFLRRQIESNHDLYQECASAIADYLLTAASMSERHEGAHRLLGVAGQWEKQAALFSSKWVIEARSVDRSLASLADEGLESCLALARLPPSWNHALDLACGLYTLAQAQRSVEAGDVPASSVRLRQPRTLSAERFVPSPESWTHEAVATAIDEIRELLASQEFDRAADAFRRWFGSISVSKVRSLVELAGRSSPRDATERSLEEDLGRLSADLALFLRPTTRDGSAAGGEAEALYARGLLYAGSRSPRPSVLCRALRRVRSFYQDDISATIAYIARQQPWRHCLVMLNWLMSVPDLPWSTRIFAALAAARLNRAWLHERWVQPLMDARSNAIDGAVAHTSRGDHSESGGPAAMCALALIFGHEDRSRDPGDVRLEMDSVYQQSNRDERSDSSVSHALYASALLGSHLPHWKRPGQVGLYLTSDRLREVAVTLMTDVQRGGARLGFGIPSISREILEGYATLVREAQDAPKSAVLRDLFLETLNSPRHPGIFLETAWHHLRAHGLTAQLREYGHKAIGEGAAIWSDSVSNQHSEIARFEPLLQSIGETALIELARKRVAWRSISYSSHKEYALALPLAWFTALAHRTPVAWRELGLRLVAISRHVSNVGDNRLGQDVDQAVLAAAARVGPTDLQRLVDLPGELFLEGDDDLIEGLIKSLDEQALRVNDLEALWILATAHLCWRRGDDRALLRHVRSAILDSVDTSTRPHVEERLRAIAPGDFASLGAISESPPVILPDPSDWCEAVANAVRQHREHGWSRLVHLLQRLDVIRPSSASSARETAWTLLKQVESRYGWTWEGPKGRDEVFRLLFPHQGDEERWAMLQAVIAKTAHHAPLTAVFILAEALIYLCLARAQATGGQAVADGLGRVLGMHEDWISGANHLPQLQRTPPGEGDGTVTWPEFCLGRILRLLKFDEQEYVQAALQGLYRACVHSPGLLGGCLERLQADPTVLRRFMIISAPLLNRIPEPLFHTWLSEKLQTARLEVALEAWVALSSLARIRDEEPPGWPSRPEWTGSPIRTVAPPLVVGPETRRGLQSSARRPSTTYFEVDPIS